ncbi:helix-turn-helix domain-containing protein [Paramicrobacterium chengjingii]|uniref:Helix-turn-helix domain-containing protein n=1 Tax=Paramicrobacterium chengjingii TaxID=2769067 RepID=A0ABX6YHG9_9MICO|nr:helix-turn-helix domain-containing protein [Microbacterium chengjingii]QPZ38150.1 helix-turn-helix domain-containing protein [Microbacterium chengjingii]
MPITQIGGALVADDETLERAAEVTAEVASHGIAGVSINTVTGETLELDLHLSDFLLNVMAGLSNGSVSITGLPEEVTTTTAAEMLGISRPTLMKRIAANEIPGHKVGSHTRLRTEDVLRLREAEDAKRTQAFNKLRRIDEEFGALG